MASDTIQVSPLLASFRASYADLLRYLTHRTGCADEAKDLAHDTWLRAADMAREGREPVLGSESEARAYLFTMARHLVMDRHRRQGVVQRHAGGLEAGAGLSLLPQAPDVAEAAMYGQAVRAVEDALAGLPERARDVFLRHRVHGEDQGALAAAYGVSRNMIERDMMQAMDRVQAALERWHAGNPPDGAATEPARRVGRRRSLTALLGVAGVSVVGGLGGWRWWRMAVPQWQHVAATGHGQTLRLPMPDGGQLTLDAQSRVEMAFYAGWRSARLLAGAAFFDVAGDAGRPFVVEVPAIDPAAAGASAAADASPVRITVLGTRFGVERLPGGAVQVQVESGRVRVETPPGTEGQGATRHELTPGMSLRWSPDAPAGQGASIARLSEPGQAAGWRHGAVAFDDAPLQEVVERLRRYLPRPVAVSPDAGTLRLSGQVRIAQAEDFVRTLPGVLPVRTRLAQGRWVVERRG